MESALVLSPSLWAAAAAVLFAAGVTQGALGFGFPAISTPLLVVLTEVKTAIILNLLPNFTVNVISVVHGGNWSASIGRYWPVAAWVLVGSWLGASFLIVAPQEPIRLLLAIAIFAYLYQQRLARLDWSWLARRPRLSAAVFGVTGGFFSGSVNNSLPPLLIYFMLLGLETMAMTQMLNGHLRAIHEAPEVGLEQLPLVFERDVFNPAVDGDTRVVDPGVKTAEPPHCRLAQAADVVVVRDIGGHRQGLAALHFNVARQAMQGRSVARRHDHLGALAGRHASSDKSNPA